MFSILDQVYENVSEQWDEMLSDICAEGYIYKAVTMESTCLIEGTLSEKTWTLKGPAGLRVLWASYQAMLCKKCYMFSFLFIQASFIHH